MRIPPTLRDRADIALIGPRRRENRLTTGTMAALARGLRFTFSTRRQTAAATLVLTGAGERVILRFRNGTPAKVRIYLIPSPASDWTFSVDVADGAAASVEFQILGTSERLDFHRRINVGERATLEQTTFFLNGGSSVASDYAVIAGTAGSLRSETLGIVSGTDRLEAVQDVRHVASATRSVLVNSLVAAGSASIAFDVTGAIAKGHAGSDCKQANRGVLLGEKASIEVSPKLLIDEYDVQAGHGCAIGRVDADELYYLTSRGLDESTARRLVVSGYIAPFVAKIDDPVVRRHVDKALSARLGGAS